MPVERTPVKDPMHDPLRRVEASASLAAAEDDRLSAVEASVAEMKAMLVTFMQSRNAPDPATAPAAPADRVLADEEVELEEVDPAYLSGATNLADDLAGYTNSNFAKLRPDLDQTARAMAACGAGLRAMEVPTGGHKHISDLPCAPLLENSVRGRAGQQGAMIAVIDDSNQIQLMKSAGELGGGRKQLSEKQLLEAIPNSFVFTEAVAYRKQYLIAKGFLHGDELRHYQDTFEPRLFSMAKQFIGGNRLLPAVEFQRSWQQFLVFERNIIFEIYEQRLSFGDLTLHINGPLMHEAMYARATAKLAAPAASGSSSKGAGGGKGGFVTHATYLATEVPEQYREECCVPFWRYGKCDRPTCTHAAGHKCLRCGATDHGGARCPRGKGAGA